MPASTSDSRVTALTDYLARAFANRAKQLAAPRGSGSSGLLAMDAPGQEILQRTAVLASRDGGIEARFVAGLPARGRSVLGREAQRMLLQDVPALVADALRAGAHDQDASCWTT